jgi:hypothetical protein
MTPQLPPRERRTANAAYSADAAAAASAAGQAAAGSSSQAKPAAATPPAPLTTLSVRDSLRTLRRSLGVLHHLASSIRGPHGGVKLVHLNPLSPSVSLSQSSSTLTTSLSVSSEHPGVSVLLNLVSRAVEGMADQGATLLHVATGLLRMHYDSLEQPHGAQPVLPVPVLMAGHQLALQWCLDFLTADFPARQAKMAAADPGRANSNTGPSQLPHPVAIIQLSNLPALLAVIRSQLASKQPLLQLSDDDRQFLSVLALQVFLQGLQRPGDGAAGGGTGFASNIRVHELPVGGVHGVEGVQRSSLFHGIVIDIPLPIHRRIEALCPPPDKLQGKPRSNLHTYVNLRVVMYDINLTFAATEHFSHDIAVQQVDDGDVDVEGGSSRYDAGVFDLMRALCAKWRALGVTLVACQKVIHPFLKQLCLEQDMLPLERLSVRHMEAVKQAAGGELLSAIDVEQVRPERLGSIARLEERIIGRRRYLFLTPAAAPQAGRPAAGVTTLLLAASTVAQQTELAALLQRVFKILTHLLRTPAVCAGAGCTEMQLAAHIRRNVAEQRRLSASSPPLPADPVSEGDDPLVSLDADLRRSHVRRGQKSAELLWSACLQLASVLEDVACFAAWNSSRMEGAQQTSGGLLLEELKQIMRDFNEPPPPSPPVVSVMQGQTKSTVLPVASSDRPLPRMGAELSEEAAAEGAAVPDVSGISLDPDQPLPPPRWHVADWKLHYESRSEHASASTTTRAMDARLVHPALPHREPHALYGFSMNQASPCVVWRTQQSSSATPPPNAPLQLDASSVLDPLYAKRAALQVAVEAAGALLRVDQVVHPRI